MMKTYTVAKAASKGIVMGKAFVAVQEDLTADSRSIKDSEREMEWLKFQKAVKDAVEDLRVLAKDSDIFAAHLDVAEDTVLHDSVELKINSENKNAQLALEETYHVRSERNQEQSFRRHQRRCDCCCGRSGTF